MAKTVLGPNTTVTVNGTDLSQFCTSVTIHGDTDDVDVTGFSETFREYLPGLKDASIDATFLQSFGSSEVDAILQPMYTNNATGTVKVKPDTTGTVVYTLISKLYGYSPVAGGVGDASTIDTTFRNAGTAGLTRGTS
jgi:hypothetical protein